MSGVSVWKRSLFIGCTIFALFVGIALMFVFLESASSTAPTDGTALNESHTGASETPMAQRMARLMALVRTEPLAEQLRFLTALPHTASSERDNVTANHVAALWTQYGVPNVEIESLDVLLSLPLRAAVLVSLAGAAARPLALNETTRTQVPQNPVTWNSYSGTGNVTANVVFCNYGRRDDFEHVKDIVPGNVALVRYGRGFRGNKVRNAERYGAVAVLIYSDPADDGPIEAENELAYPDGPWRAAGSVQRGSLYSFGDPLTPGFGAEAGSFVPRLKQSTLRQNKDAHWLPTVPVMPLSFNDARVMLEALEGAARFDGTAWRVGATSAVRATVDVEMEESVRRIWNVLGRIDGVEDDSPVILGNHRDAWTYGAVDPSSGSTTLNEVVHAFGTLHASGWKPRRTLVFASWDAEEFGLIGSTEYVERRRTELGRNTVVYLNVDEACAGHTRLFVDSVPSLSRTIREVAARVPYRQPTGKMRAPEEAISYMPHANLLAFWAASQNASTSTPPVRGATLPSAGLIGSGSDFVAFLQLIGVPALNLMFGFERVYGAYHSNDDNFDWMVRFGDPGFTRHQMLAQLWAGIALRFADERTLPFDFVEYASEIRRYVGELKAYAALETHGDVAANSTVWSPLNGAVDSFERAAASVARLQQISVNLTDAAVAALNRRLVVAERAFLDRRELFRTMRHVLFRPHGDNMYAGTALPSLYGVVNDYAASYPRNETIMELLEFEAAAVAVSIEESASLLRPRNLQKGLL
jgi:N-acetylated-alpha-linked acidic dipeptidase